MAVSRCIFPGGIGFRFWTVLSGSQDGGPGSPSHTTIAVPLTRTRDGVQKPVVPPMSRSGSLLASDPQTILLASTHKAHETARSMTPSFEKLHVDGIFEKGFRLHNSSVIHPNEDGWEWWRLCGAWQTSRTERQPPPARHKGGETGKRKRRKTGRCKLSSQNGSRRRRYVKSVKDLWMEEAKCDHTRAVLC